MGYKLVTSKHLLIICADKHIKDVQ